MGGFKRELGSPPILILMAVRNYSTWELKGVLVVGLKGVSTEHVKT
jgi:hypothetical protein